MIRLQELELVFGHTYDTYVRTDGRTDGWTHRRDVGNSILDFEIGNPQKKSEPKLCGRVGAMTELLVQYNKFVLNR